MNTAYVFVQGFLLGCGALVAVYLGAILHYGLRDFFRWLSRRGRS